MEPGLLRTPKGRFFSLGTSTRSWEEFLSLLHQYGIETVVDVRRFPTSRFEHFKKEHLERELPRQHIAYIWMGNELGGFRKGGYAAYLQTAAFRSGLRQLLAIAVRHTTVIICRERFPWKCHRRYIAAEAHRAGWRVTHILSPDRCWEPRSLAP